MIEIIYRTNQAPSDIRQLKLPKNVKQTGTIDKNTIIYLEATVAKFLENPMISSNDVAFGVLLGNSRNHNEKVYIFVNALVAATPTENLVDFDEHIWNQIYDDIRRYYNEAEIVGWYLSIPYRVSNDLDNLLKIHLDNFSGENRVCYFTDRQENDSAFYMYDGKMSRQGGYYVYSEKNECLSRYLMELSQNALKIIAPRKDIIQNSGTIKPNKANSTERKNKFSQLFAALTSVAAIIVAIYAMGKYGDVKSLRTSVEKIVQFESSQERTTMVTKVEKVAGSIKPTEKEQENKSNETTSDFTNQSGETSNPDETETSETRIASKNENIPMSYYTVKEGETLFEICIKVYNDAGMLEQLKLANNLDDDCTIEKGQKLILP